MERTPEAEAEYQNWMKGQPGYIGKENKADWWNSWEKTQESKKTMDNYLTNPGGQFEVYGNGDQQKQVATDLSQVGAMTGQNIFQTSQQQQDYYKSLEDRRNGDDAVAANMQAGRNRNLANVGRQFAGRSVAGGVAAAGMNTAQNTADSEINSQMQTNARQNDNDLWNYVKRNQKVTGEALSSGEDKGLADGMDTSQAQGVFGTVICTELHRQGFMSAEMYALEVIVGKRVEAEAPEVMEGYRYLAAPVVRLMKKSKLFTKLVSKFAIPWARTMTGDYNLLGDTILLIGFPICEVVGSLLKRKEAVA